MVDPTPHRQELPRFPGIPLAVLSSLAGIVAAAMALTSGGGWLLALALYLGGPALGIALIALAVAFTDGRRTAVLQTIRIGVRRRD